MKKVIDCTLEKEGFIGLYYPGTKETNKARQVMHLLMELMHLAE